MEQLVQPATFRDWRTVGVQEYGYVAPDPLNPNIIYGGKATRFEKTTGQVQSIAPEAVRSGKYRYIRTAPLIFSTIDPHVLYLGANCFSRPRTAGRVGTSSALTSRARRRKFLRASASFVNLRWFRAKTQRR